MPENSAAAVEAYHRGIAGLKSLLAAAETLARAEPYPDCEELIFWLRLALAEPPAGARYPDPDYVTDQYPAHYRVNCLDHAQALAEKLARQFQIFAPETGMAPRYQTLAQDIAQLKALWQAQEPDPPIIAAVAELPAERDAEKESSPPPPASAAAAARRLSALPDATPEARPDPADPPPEQCQVLLEARDLLPAVKAGFPEALQEGLRWHGSLNLTQYIALTGDVSLRRLKDRLAFTADHEDVGYVPLPVEILTTHCNEWDCLQTQVFRYMINIQGFPPEGRCPDDGPTLRRIAKNLDELSYRALGFLAQLAERYSWQPFQLLNIHFQTALEQADPPLTLADFLRPEGVREYQEHISHRQRGPHEPPPQLLPFRNAEGEVLFLTKEHLDPENSACLPRLRERLRRLEAAAATPAPGGEPSDPEPLPPLRPPGFLNPTRAAGLLSLYRQFYYAFQWDTANDAPELEEAAFLAQQAGIKAADLEMAAPPP